MHVHRRAAEKRKHIDACCLTAGMRATASALQCGELNECCTVVCRPSTEGCVALDTLMCPRLGGRKAVVLQRVKVVIRIW